MNLVRVDYNYPYSFRNLDRQINAEPFAFNRANVKIKSRAMIHFQHPTDLKEEPVVASPQVIKEKKRVFKNEAEERVYQFVSRFCRVDASDTLVLSSTQQLDLSVNKPEYLFRSIVNLRVMNEAQKLSGYIAEINSRLRDEGLFICCLETSKLRRLRFYKKYPVGIRRVNYFFDYLLRRVAPTMKATRWLYKWLTGDRHKVVSFFEMVGRLVYCGFEVEHDEIIDGLHYLVARKVSAPPRPPLKERYGLLFSQERIGQHGKKIKVYKFRTMVAFSEYVQEHIYRHNSLDRKGKFRDDKRVTILGGFFRRFWLDEWPMLINLLKGDMKLVGVRPLSEQYLKLYDPEVIQKRLSVKPGLVPPYYVDLPSTLAEIQISEMRYIERYKKAPLKTDLIYFFKAFWNIIGCGARSK